MVHLSVPSLQQSHYHTITNEKYYTIQLPTATDHHHSTNNQIGMLVESNYDIQLRLYHDNADNCETFNVIPIDSLGTKYYLVTPDSDDGSSYGTTTVIITEDNTDLTVMAPQYHEARIRCNDQIISGEDPEYVVRVQRHDVITMKSISGDITGTLISGNGRKIAVFMGGTDMMSILQMIPVESYGMQYVLMETSAPEQIRYAVIAGESNTHCMSASIDILKAGQSHYGADHRIISFSKPVLLVQFLPQSNRMLQVQATERYLTKYFIHTSGNVLAKSRIIITIAKHDQQQIIIDGNPQQMVWHDIKDSQPTLSMASMDIVNGQYVVKQKDGGRFGLILSTLQVDGCESVFVPGMCFEEVSFAY